METIVNDLLKTVNCSAEFNAVFKKLRDCHIKNVYLELLLQFKETIWSENINKFKDLCVLISNIHDIVPSEIISNYLQSCENPFKNTNIIIFTCLADKPRILEYIFNKDNDFLSKLSCIASTNPSDVDEENHNAIYYAARSKNTELVKIVIEMWPNNYFDDNPNRLWKILSEAFEELKLKHVALLEENECYIENKLISLLLNADESNVKEFTGLENVEKRLELLIEKIEFFLEQYNVADKVDFKFLFIARFIAKNIHILKLQLKCTYAMVPWEEIEFFVIIFVSAFNKIQDNVLIYYTVLLQEKLFKYLKLFVTTLKGIKKEFKNLDASQLAVIPDLQRDSVSLLILSKNPSFADFYQDFRRFRDIYTLNRMNYYIKIALSADINSLEGQLTVMRVCQVLEGSLKNSLEQPELSPEIVEIILFCCSAKVRSAIQSNYFSKSRFCYGKLIKEGVVKNITFIKSVQKCLTDIEEFISHVKCNHTKSILMSILQDVSSSDAHVMQFADFFQGIELISIVKDSLLHNNCRTIGKLFTRLKRMFVLESEYEVMLMAKINRLIECNDHGNTSEEVKDCIIGTNYFHGFGAHKLHLMISVIVEHLNTSKGDDYSLQMAKTSFKTMLGVLKSRMMLTEYHEAINQLLKLCRVVAPRLKNNNDLCNIYATLLQICFFTEFVLLEESWMKNVKEHSVSHVPVVPNNIDDELESKVTILHGILSNHGLEQGIHNTSYLKGSPYCRLSVEVIVADVISILDEKFGLCDNFSSLDDNITILSGKFLLVHLLRVVPLADILLSNPLTAMVAFAQTLIANTTSVGGKILMNIEKNKLTEISRQFDKLFEITDYHDKMLEAIVYGNFEEFERCVQNGADLYYRSQFCQTLLHLASKGSNLDIVKYLLDKNVSISEKDYRGQNALHIAAKCGKMNIAKFYVSNFKISINDTDKSSKNTLHLSAQSGINELVEFFLKCKLNVFSKDSKHWLPIHYAVSSGHIDVVKTLLEAEPMLMNSHTNTDDSLLHIAIGNSDLSMVNLLLQCNIDVNKVSKDKLSPLHIACLHGHVGIVKLLIQSKPNWALLTKEHLLTPLFLAVKGRFTEIVQVLLENGSSDVVDFCHAGSLLTPLHIAAKSGDLEIVQLLLDSGADVDKVTESGEIALHYASSNGHTDVVNILLKHGSNVNHGSVAGETSLHLSVKNQHCDGVQLLINNKANINCKNIYDRTPLHFAAACNNKEIVLILLSGGANINSKATGDMTPLHCSVLFNQPEIVDIFLNKNAKIGGTFLMGTTALHLAAQLGSVGIVKLLLTAGVHMERKQVDGKVPLHFAVLSGNKEVVDLLLKQNVRVDSKDKRGHTPLVLAVQGNDIGIVRTLIQHGADVNLSCSTHGALLCIAVANNFVEMVDLLISSGAQVNAKTGKALLTAVSLGHTNIVHILLQCEQINVTFRNSDKLNAIHIAAKSGHSTILKYLLDKGLDANLVTFSKAYKKNCPLYLATLNNHEECVKILIDHGADPNTSTNGESILHLAVYKNSVNLVTMMLDNGADPHAGNSQQISPLEAAAKIGNQRILKLFLQPKIVYKYLKIKLESLLHYAARHCNKFSVSLTIFIVGTGADIHEKNVDGLKAIHIAAEKGDKNLIEYYLHNGISVDDRGGNDWSLLHYAVFYDHAQLVKYLMEQKINLDMNDCNGSTPLHIAAKHNASTTCVTALLNNGAVYNTLDKSLKSPFDITQNEEIERILSSTGRLFTLVNRNKTNGVKECILGGGIINARNREKATPLQCAVSKGFSGMASVLLKNNANPNIIDSQGNPISHIAAKSSRLNILKSLFSYGAIYNARNTQGKTLYEVSMQKDIVKFLDLIVEAFNKLNNDSENIFNYLKVITDLEVVKAILNVHNSDNKSFLTIAIQKNLPQAALLVDLLQSLTSPQASEAKLLFSQGKYAECNEVFSKVLKEHEELLGPNHAATLDIKSSIAQSMYALSDLSKALTIYESIHLAEKLIYDKDNQIILRTENNMSLILAKQGKFSQALPVLQKNYNKLKILLGENHIECVVTQLNILDVLINLKRYEEALILCYEIYEKNKEDYGKTHNNTLSLLNKIAIIEQQQGHFEEAQRVYQEVYTHRKGILGAHHIETQRTLHYLASIYCVQEKYEPALLLYNELLELQKKTLGPAHIDTLNTQICIANSFFRSGKILAALRIYNESLENRAKLLGFSHPDIENIRKRIREIVIKFSTIYSDDTFENADKYLSSAAEQGNYVAVQDLILYGVDPNVQDKVGRTSLHCAVNCHQVAVVRLLLYNGSDATILTSKGNNALHTATFRRSLTIVQLLLKHMKKYFFNKFHDFINASTSKSQSTALHIACKNNSLSIVKCLLKYGAFYYPKDKSNRTPLECAKEDSIIKFLSIVDNLFNSVKKGNDTVVDTIKLMDKESFEAVMNTCNASSQTLTQIALINKHKNLAKHLLKLYQNID